jgi:hypothetical protein
MYKKSHRSINCKDQWPTKRAFGMLRCYALLSSSGKWVAALTFIQRPSLLNEPAQDKLSCCLSVSIFRKAIGIPFFCFMLIPIQLS